MKLILGVHNHQPVGNFDHVIADVYAKAYLPFIDRLERHPQIRLCMHHSGPLWEWIEANRPEYLERLAELVRAGRLEILGGAFYEPILTAIPEADRLGQIRMMTEAVRERFGAEVRGMWLAERVWEPQLTASLAAAGVAYVLLDDYHFVQSGLSPAELTAGPLQTEELGATVALFPISERLRYLIPFREPEETVALCRELHERDPDGVLVMVDDGEKFGSWPETYTWVYTKGWLERFFRALAAEGDWLTLATPGEVLTARPPTRTVYLPPGSYFEMTEWALPVPAAERFLDLVAEAKDSGRWPVLRSYLRGGFWRQFLQRYSESASMYHRALLLHHDLADVSADVSLETVKTARRELWQAQCNCAYWHGVFGGLYLPHLRHAVHAHLIAGSKQIAAALPTAGVQAVSLTGSGSWDLRLGNEKLDLFLAPGWGGAIVGLEDREACWDLQNTLRRRREAYHRKIENGTSSADQSSGHDSIHDRSQEISPELRRALVVDPQPRVSLLDRLLHLDVAPGETLHDMAAADGGDFAAVPMSLEQPRQSLARDGALVKGWFAPGPATVVCQRLGRYRDRAGRQLPVQLQKEVTLDGESAGLRVCWRLRNDGEEHLRCRFASEWNLALLQGQTYLDASREHQELLAPGSLAPRSELVIVVPHYDARLTWASSSPSAWWIHEVQTVSQAESGFELNYQGHLLLAVWEMDLAPAGEDRFELSFTIAR